MLLAGPVLHNRVERNPLAVAQGYPIPKAGSSGRLYDRLTEGWGCWGCWGAQQRDAGRAFVLGERIPYVLLPGPATQDEAAEDPLAAAKAGLQGDLELYWKNKLLRPLSELLKPCLPAAQVQARHVVLFLQKQWCHDKHSGLQSASSMSRTTVALLPPWALL